MDLTNTALKSPTYQRWVDSEDLFWKGSEFEKFRNFASRKKGKEGEHLAADLLEAQGSTIPRGKKGEPTKPKGSGSEFDIFPDKIKTEVKTSSAWNGTRCAFRWQQLRDQLYERIVFIGINPNELYMWWCTKADLEKHIFGRDEFRQHAGKDGGQELYWISTQGGSLTPDVPAWFRSMDTWND
jgi:hypothetical protein